MQTILTLTGTLFVIMLTLMGIFQLWMPDTFSNEAFIKMTITFGALTLAALSIKGLSSLKNSNNSDEETAEDEKKF